MKMDLIFRPSPRTSARKISSRLNRQRRCCVNVLIFYSNTTSHNRGLCRFQWGDRGGISSGFISPRKGGERVVGKDPRASCRRGVPWSLGSRHTQDEDCNSLQRARGRLGGNTSPCTRTAVSGIISGNFVRKGCRQPPCLMTPEGDHQLFTAFLISGGFAFVLHSSRCEY